jgi:hypothetical protein
MGSFAYSEQKDQRVVAEQAELVVSPESQYVSPRSVGVVADAWSKVSLSDVTFNEFPESLQKSVAGLVDVVSETSRITQTETFPLLVDSYNQALEEMQYQSQRALESQQELGQTAIQGYIETSKEVTEHLGQKLQETQLGQAAILPGVAKYIAIAVVVLLVARYYSK